MSDSVGALETTHCHGKLSLDRPQNSSDEMKFSYAKLAQRVTPLLYGTIGTLSFKQ